MKLTDNTFSVEKAEESSGFLLWQVTNLWQREIKKALKEFGLTHSQYVLLASIHWLTLHNQEVTQVVLSNHTKIDAMSTSTVLRTLQQKEFLQVLLLFLLKKFQPSFFRQLLNVQQYL